MKALVTGGTGFIGRHVVQRLVDEGHAVRVLSRRPPPAADEQGPLEFFEGDLRDVSSVLRAMGGRDVLFHVGEIKNVTSLAAERNVRLMEHIIDAADAEGLGRIVFISSVSVAGIPLEVPATEETRPSVVLADYYTAYKRRCEELLAASSCEYSVIRPAPVYGPGSRYLGRLVNAIDRIGPLGFPFLGNGRNIAPLVYVKDLARAITLAGTKPAARRETFNLTDGERHSWLDFFGSIADCLGRQFRIIPLPPLAFTVPGLLLDLFSGALGMRWDLSSYLSFLTKDLLFDNRKARELLAWAPEFTLAQGVAEMVKHCREDGK